MSRQHISVVIQAGGASSRMGQDKGLVLFRAQPLVQRVLQRVQEVGEELFVTTNRPDAYAFLGVRLVGDLIPNYGALGGLYTALKAAAGELVAVVACDMPFASASLLRLGIDWLEHSLDDAAVPRLADGNQPFHAVYRRRSCLPLIEAAIANQKRRVDAWFSTAKIHYLSGQEISRYDPAGLAFLNVNTPEELVAAEGLPEP
jgi:molybdopterin-guanine dinucleotide biosynthesis protein A